MKRLLHEPLLHFLLLGAILFGVYSALNKTKTTSRDDIVVTTGQIENFAATFAKVWQRPPSSEELKAQIDQYVREEILSREAIKLGLDQNDTVIRRRLQQKMEFIAEDFAASEPTEGELAEYLATHPDRFAQEQRFSFRQVFLSSEKRGKQLQADTTALLTQLKRDGAGADVSGLGDSLLLPREFTSEPERSVASQFGQEFAAELATLKAGEWSGPIESGYGTHLVLITQRTEGRLVALTEVREQVMRELMNERRLAANERYLAGLLAKYRVTIQSPRSAPPAKTTAMK